MGWPWPGASYPRRGRAEESGVTAGIDMALAVTAEIAGNEYAQSVQLGIRGALAYPSCPEAPQRWDSWRLEAPKTL